MVCLNRDTRKKAGMPDVYYRTCFWCRDNFGMPRNIFRGKVRLGQTKFFCSDKCLSDHDAWVLQVKRLRNAHYPITRHVYRCHLFRAMMCKHGHDLPEGYFGRCMECKRISSRKYWHKRSKKAVA